MSNVGPPRKSVKPEAPAPLIRQGSLGERVYLELRERLQRCEIGPEQRLVDVEVAATYGVSRMPAREALLRLANEGYLTGTTRGFVTPKLTMQDIADVFEIRAWLEPRAAANAARDMSDATRATLAMAIARARAAGDNVDELILANIAFRQAWLGALRNERLIATIGRFVDHVQTIRLGTLRDPQTREVVIAGLEALNEAFQRADPAAAERQMTRFVEAAREAYFKIRQREIDDDANEARAAGATR